VIAYSIGFGLIANQRILSNAAVDVLVTGGGVTEEKTAPFRMSATAAHIVCRADQSFEKVWKRRNECQE
jgi:hypothetical protein